MITVLMETPGGGVTPVMTAAVSDFLVNTTGLHTKN